jgi:hypothetical protein
MDDREAFGWFGEPWPSVICYDDDGNLNTGMHKAFPTGERCIYCEELFDEAAGDSGKAIPSPEGSIEHAHKECLLVTVVGSLGYGLDTPDSTFRQNALEVWRQLAANYGPSSS